jgi:hypothetical protein
MLFGNEDFAHRRASRGKRGFSALRLQLKARIQKRRQIFYLNRL